MVEHFELKTVDARPLHQFAGYVPAGARDPVSLTECILGIAALIFSRICSL
jgi:hypothetical protein